jgi:hypothetical protein
MFLSTVIVFAGNNAVGTLTNEHSKYFLIMSQDWTGANCIYDNALGYDCDMKLYSADLTEDVVGRGYINDTDCRFTSLDHSIKILCEDPLNANITRVDLVTGSSSNEKLQANLLD